MSQTIGETPATDLSLYQYIQLSSRKKQVDELRRQIQVHEDMCKRVRKILQLQLDEKLRAYEELLAEQS